MSVTYFQCPSFVSSTYPVHFSPIINFSMAICPCPCNYTVRCPCVFDFTVRCPSRLYYFVRHFLACLTSQSDVHPDVFTRSTFTVRCPSRCIHAFDIHSQMSIPTISRFCVFDFTVRCPSRLFLLACFISPCPSIFLPALRANSSFLNLQSATPSTDFLLFNKIANRELLQTY